MVTVAALVAAVAMEAGAMAAGVGLAVTALTDGSGGATQAMAALAAGSGLALAATEYVVVVEAKTCGCGSNESTYYKSYNNPKILNHRLRFEYK